jgi:hypothetical protein
LGRLTSETTGFSAYLYISEMMQVILDAHLTISTLSQKISGLEDLTTIAGFCKMIMLRAQIGGFAKIKIDKKALRNREAG